LAQGPPAAAPGAPAAAPPIARARGLAARMGNHCCVCEEEDNIINVDKKHAAADAAAMGNYRDLCADDTDKMMSAASMYGMSTPEAARKREASDVIHAKDAEAPKAGRVCVTVHRDSVEEKLGIDVKHVSGKLVVVGILSDGAVHRAVARSRARGGDVLEIGDTIVQINDVANHDAAMVQECRESAILVFHAERKKNQSTSSD